MRSNDAHTANTPHGGPAAYSSDLRVTKLIQKKEREAQKVQVQGHATQREAE